MWSHLARALYAFLSFMERNAPQAVEEYGAPEGGQPLPPPPPDPKVEAVQPTAESQLSTPPKARTATGLAGELVEHYEGCRLVAYLCPAGVPTIGFGHTKGVRMGTRIDLPTAHILLASDMAEAASAVWSLVKVPLEPHQLAALIDFTFNLGAGALKSSTLLRRLNAGDYGSVPAQLLRWVNGGGKELPGLVKRRTAEAHLWASGTLSNPLP